MNTTDLSYLALHEVRAMLDRGEVSSLELTEACLARIRRDGERLVVVWIEKVRTP